MIRIGSRIQNYLNIKKEVLILKRKKSTFNPHPEDNGENIIMGFLVGFISGYIYNSRRN